MEFFNYVMVLASVIVGLAVAHLLQGVAKMVQEPDRKKLYWVHLLWIFLMFHNAFKNRIAKLVHEVGIVSEGLMSRFETVSKKAPSLT